MKTKTSKTKKNANRDASIRELDNIAAQIERNQETADAKIGAAERKLTAAKARAAKALATANKRAEKIIADATKLSQQIEADAEKAYGLALEAATSQRQAVNGPLRRRQDFLRSEARRSFVPAHPSIGLEPKDNFRTASEALPPRPCNIRMVPESAIPRCVPHYVRRNGEWIRVIRGR